MACPYNAYCLEDSCRIESVGGRKWNDPRGVQAITKCGILIEARGHLMKAFIMGYLRQCDFSSDLYNIQCGAYINEKSKRKRCSNIAIVDLGRARASEPWLCNEHNRLQMGKADRSLFEEVESG